MQSSMIFYFTNYFQPFPSVKIFPIQAYFSELELIELTLTCYFINNYNQY